MITKCINNDQLKNKSIGSKLYFRNQLYRIIEISYFIPRRLRKQFPEDKYAQCKLKLIKS